MSYIHVCLELFFKDLFVYWCLVDRNEVSSFVYTSSDVDTMHVIMLTLYTL